jgi:hypothetical protein
MGSEKHKTPTAFHELESRETTSTILILLHSCANFNIEKVGVGWHHIAYWGIPASSCLIETRKKKTQTLFLYDGAG